MLHYTLTWYSGGQDGSERLGSGEVMIQRWYGEGAVTGGVPHMAEDRRRSLGATAMSIALWRSDGAVMVQ